MSENGDEPDEPGTGGVSDNGRTPQGGDGSPGGRTDGDGSSHPRPDGDGSRPAGERAETAPGDWGSPDAGGEEPWAFEEVQRFRQRWLWATIAAVSALAVLTVVVQRPGPVLSSFLLALTAVGIAGSYVTELRTEVREDGLHVRLVPLHRSTRQVPFAEIEDHETTEFRAFRDFGGIGIRRTPGGWAYVVTSGGGVRIDRGDEEPSVVVGSERPEELDRALAAGVARAEAVVEGDDQPRWRAVADFQRSPGDAGGAGTGGEDPGGAGADGDADA